MKGEPLVMQEALKANGKCGEQLAGYKYPRFCRFNVVTNGKCRHHRDGVDSRPEPDWRNIALRLAEALNYWLPDEEPYSPITKNKKQIYHNLRWREACDVLDGYKKGIEP